VACFVAKKAETEILDDDQCNKLMNLIINGIYARRIQPVDIRVENRAIISIDGLFRGEDGQYRLAPTERGKQKSTVKQSADPYAEEDTGKVKHDVMKKWNAYLMNVAKKQAKLEETIARAFPEVARAKAARQKELEEEEAAEQEEAEAEEEEEEEAAAEEEEEEEAAEAEEAEQGVEEEQDEEEESEEEPEAEEPEGPEGEDDHDE
jgi:hypothetical protein